MRGPEHRQVHPWGVGRCRHLVLFPWGRVCRSHPLSAPWLSSTHFFFFYVIVFFKKNILRYLCLFI